MNRPQPNWISPMRSYPVKRKILSLKEMRLKVEYNSATSAWEVLCPKQAAMTVLRSTIGTSSIRNYRGADSVKNSWYHLSIPDYERNYRSIMRYIQSYGASCSPEDFAILKKYIDEFSKRKIAIEAYEKNPDAEIPWAIPPAYPLWPYQIRAVNFTLASQRYINADPLGSGKTEMSLATAGLRGALPMLVVVPTHLVMQWKKRAAAMFPGIQVLDLDGPKLGTTNPQTIFITTYTKMVLHLSSVKSHPFRSIIFDEAHALRNQNTARWSAAKKLASHPTVRYCIGCTASPIYNYTGDVYGICSVIAPNRIEPKRLFSSFFKEATMNRVVKNGQIVVDKAVAMARSLTKRGLLLARTQEELGIKPLTIHRDFVPVESTMTDAQIYDESSRLAVSKSGTTELMNHTGGPLQLVTSARRLTSVAKAHASIEYIHGLLEEGLEKVVVAAFFRQTHDEIRSRLGKYGIRFITGHEGSSEKSKSVSDFIEKKDVRILVLSLSSGEGIDGLQKVCNHVVILDLAWTPALHDQIAGRLCRPGQEKPVYIHFLHVDVGTDPSIIEILAYKKILAMTFAEVTEASVSKKVLSDLLRRQARPPAPRIAAIDSFTMKVSSAVATRAAVTSVATYLEQVISELTTHALSANDPIVWDLISGLDHSEVVKAANSASETTLVHLGKQTALILSKSMQYENLMWEVYSMGLTVPHAVVLSPTGGIPSAAGNTHIYPIRINPIAVL